MRPQGGRQADENGVAPDGERRPKIEQHREHNEGEAEAENGSDEDVAKACGVAPVIEAHREQRTGTGYCEDYTVPKVVVELLRRAPPDQGGEIERGEERSEEHTSELQSLMRSSYAVFCLKKKKQQN